MKSSEVKTGDRFGRLTIAGERKKVKRSGVEYYVFPVACDCDPSTVFDCEFRRLANYLKTQCDECGTIERQRAKAKIMAGAFYRPQLVRVR